MALARYSSWKLLLFSFLSISCFRNGALAASQVPCFFIFGDSLCDNGNNNDLITEAKANFLPYGIDFPEGSSSGRFTNGQNLADFIAQLLGFDRYIQNFTAAQTDHDMLRGVNYASGAAGIRDETGFQQGERISFNHQLSRHSTIIWKIRQMLGQQGADSLLSRCIYMVELGNNDYINNYFMPQFYPTSREYTPQQFAVELANQYAQQLTTLYDRGARKVAIIGPGLIGCTPEEIYRFGTTNGSTCNDQINGAVILFNNMLKPLVQGLNSKFVDARFTLIDMIEITNSSAASLAQLNTTAPCCEILPSLGTCKPNGTVCAVRDAYAFFDGFHLTQIVYQGLAARSYTAVQPGDAYPYDIRSLAQM